MNVREVHRAPQRTVLSRAGVKVFATFSKIGFFEEAARRLITIYRDEPAYRNTSELLKAHYVCLCGGGWVCVRACARPRRAAVQGRFRE